MLLDIKKKDNKQRFRDCIKFDSGKWDIENNQKITFLIQCVQIFEPTFYETTIISL